MTQAGSKVSLEDVGSAARGLATNLAHMGKNAKCGAFLLTDNSAQQSLLQSAKTVGLLAQQLVTLGRDTQVNILLDQLSMIDSLFPPVIAM